MFPVDIDDLVVVFLDVECQPTQGPGKVGGCRLLAVAEVGWYGG
jgi:hypothetical protein